MKQEKEGAFVALTKCFFCMGDNYILLHKRMGDVSEYHGKVIDTTPCNECKEFMEQGVILLTIDPEKSQDGWEKNDIPNPYRTGGFFVVTETGFRGLFETEEEEAYKFGIKHRWMFIEHVVAVQIGLMKEEQDEH